MMDGRYSVKRWGHRFSILAAPRCVLAASFLGACCAFATEPVIDCVEVKTRAKENALVKVWYRVPRSYDPQKKGLSRVLILFGGRNCGVYPETSAVAAPAFVACGTEDSDRLRISRDFVYRARESGGLILCAADQIDPEFRNPLFTQELLALWRR